MINRLSKLTSVQKRHAGTLLEWLLIAIWGTFVERAYLNNNPYIWPSGLEIGIKLLSHQFWVNLSKCGSCALWNGSINGGRPALADLFGSQFHPLIAIPTLLWGVVNGAKISVILIVILTGLGQWWIAKELKLGRVARVWSGLLAIVGGHLATQHYWGNIGIMLGLASCTLVIATTLSLGQAPTRQKAIILAINGSLLLLSGQGYLQIAMITWFFAIPAFLINREIRAKVLWREIFLAVGLSLLLIGFLLVPIIHFGPNYTKSTADPTFAFAQPLEYIPLNLVIRDWNYYQSAVLGKQISTDVVFIGWVPVILAILTLRFAQKKDLPAIGFLAIGALITFWFSSPIPLRWLASFSNYFLWIKYPFIFTGLAVPPILGLAAFGLEKLIQLDWPKILLTFTDDKQQDNGVNFNLRWLLVFPLAASLYISYDFSQRFIALRDMTPYYTRLIPQYKLSSTQWIQSPQSEHDWSQPELDLGHKITGLVFSGAQLAGHELPPPYLAASRGTFQSDSPLEQVGLMDDLPIYRFPDNEYAYIEISDRIMVACQANAAGGNISVNCPPALSGTLIVHEYSYDGWNALVDGIPTNLLIRPWLSIKTEAGEHSYKFVYQPWDIVLGILVSITGIVACVILWIRAQHPIDQSTLIA